MKFRGESAEATRLEGQSKGEKERTHGPVALVRVNGPLELPLIVVGAANFGGVKSWVGDQNACAA